LRFKYALRTNFFANRAMLDTITVSQPPVLWKFIKAGQVDTTNVFSEKLTFKKLPPMNLDYWKFFVQNKFSIGSLTPPYAYANEDPTVYGEVTTGAYHFGYDASSKSATAARAGKQLGDPRWALFVPTSVKGISGNNDATKVYPNPFKESVTFHMQSEKVAEARITIFDLSGRMIFNKIQQLNAGSNPVNLNLGAFPGNVFVYQVVVGAEGEAQVVSRGKLLRL